MFSLNYIVFFFLLCGNLFALRFAYVRSPHAVMPSLSGCKGVLVNAAGAQGSLVAQLGAY